MEDILGVSIETITNNALSWAKQLVAALLILWIGMRVAKLMIRGFNKAMTFRSMDPSLTTFLESLLKIALQAFVLIAAINQ